MDAIRPLVCTVVCGRAGARNAGDDTLASLPSARRRGGGARRYGSPGGGHAVHLLPPPVEFISRPRLERLPRVGVPDTFELSGGRVAPWVVTHVIVSGAVGWRVGTWCPLAMSCRRSCLLMCDKEAIEVQKILPFLSDTWPLCRIGRAVIRASQSCRQSCNKSQCPACGCRSHHSCTHAPQFSRSFPAREWGSVLQRQGACGQCP